MNKYIIPITCAMCIQAYYSMMNSGALHSINGKCVPSTCVLSCMERNRIGRRLEDGQYKIKYSDCVGDVGVVWCAPDGDCEE